MKKHRFRQRPLGVERLEPRLALSLTFNLDAVVSADAHEPLAADARGAGAKPTIRLDLVALHEFGHSLGLDHSSDPNSIMYPYYNANYNKANFAGDSAVLALRSLYSSANVLSNNTPWKDSLDPQSNDGQVDVTYSFMPDGARMDKGTSSTFATFDGIFGAGDWQAVFVGELNRWAENSGATLAFHSFSSSTDVDSGRPFNYGGSSQNDSQSGDIRIAAHRFDGAGNTLAHAYFAPPNGATAAGDAHFDQAENWVLSGASVVAEPRHIASRGGRGDLVLALPVEPPPEATFGAHVAMASSGPVATATTEAAADETSKDKGPWETPARQVVWDNSTWHLTTLAFHQPSNSPASRESENADDGLGAFDLRDVLWELDWLAQRLAGVAPGA